MLSEHRDMAAAKAFFRSAKSATGMTPDRVTTDGHGSYPRAIRSTLGREVKHRTSVYENSRLEQDHRGVKGRIRCMRGFKEFGAADRFCRGYDELRAFLRLRTRHNQHVSASRRRLLISVVQTPCSPSCKQHRLTAFFDSRWHVWRET
jgi:putative transposase